MFYRYIASMITPTAKAAAKKVPAVLLAELKAKSPVELIHWVQDCHPRNSVLTTSFGAQSAALLHLTVQILPDLPIVFIDTGYHFPETLTFAKEMQARLKLNLKVFQPLLSPKEIEKKHGRLWESGPEGLQKFHQIIRVEPLQRAWGELNPELWIAGLRRSTAESREKLEILSRQDSRLKLLPILDWTDRQIGAYLKAHSLPYHPLWSQGYVSIGDRVTTKRLDQVTDPSQLRHFGWKRECGIHN